MNNAKHTPGPWIVRETPSQNPFVYEASTGRIIAGVARVRENMDCVENAANSCLIAAAPELLAALEALLNYDNLGAYDRANVRKQARAAIVKAKGE